MASEKPDVLEVLNNPPEVHVFDINQETNKEPLQRTISENSLGKYHIYGNCPKTFYTKVSDKMAHALIADPDCFFSNRLLI